MSKTARLGAFIFVALAIFAVVIFLIGEKQFLFSRTYLLKATFDNVAGLDAGAPVRAGGVRIGTVEKIQLPSRPGEKILIEMQLTESTQSVLRKDSVAAIETEGLLGSKYLEITFGSAQGEPLRNGDMVATRPPLDYADIARKASATIDTAKAAIESAKEAIDSSHTAISNLNTATDDVKSITGKIDRGEGTIGAFVNDKAMFENINATTASLREMVGEAKTGVVSFQENMEALKHNFFFRGFFKDRGYFASADLTKYAVDRLPSEAPLKKYILAGKDLFDGPETAKLDKEKLLDEVGKFLAYTGPKGTSEENLTLSQARAAVVRQYLVEKFNVDDTRIRTLGQGEEKDANAKSEGHVEIYIYGGEPSRVVEAKTEGQK
jgi:phospholipid/cholesterol/gamma-HCH transport system substrate-binding protein